MAGYIDSRAPVVLAVTVAMTLISSVFIILRFVSRIGIVHRVGWDDWTILLAWVRWIPFHPEYGCYLTDSS